MKLSTKRNENFPEKGLVNAKTTSYAILARGMKRGSTLSLFISLTPKKASGAEVRSMSFIMRKNHVIYNPWHYADPSI